MEHDTGSLGWLFSELFQTDKVRKINSFFDAAVIDLVHICPAHMRVLHSCGTHVLHTCMSCTHACLAHMCVLRTCVSFTHACFAFMRDCVTRVMHTCLSCIHACPTYMRVLHTCVSYILVCVFIQTWFLNYMSNLSYMFLSPRGRERTNWWWAPDVIPVLKPVLCPKVLFRLFAFFAWD